MRGVPAAPARLLVFGAAFALVTGCLVRSAAPAPHHPLPAAVAPGFNPTDRAWLQLMFAMEERVLPLLDLGARRGRSPAVRRLAGRIRPDHATGLGRLRDGLRRAALPARNVHEGHDMPGMVTPAKLAALAATTGAAFDRLFVTRLREHLDQTAMVSRSERLSGADRATKDLAAAIERSGAAERRLLDGIQDGG
ncbi:DUF305 domain-containing protein [Sphaerisporangium fuscum]|uniref:DUF305 domain-containing protein n=1 Tax=Sphaerisporangium fuscum TaxID=2835868 RepID=UPI001BDCDFBB|nr:DUF305 domain-containing protein [Sphaerisporangium fuscum]